MSLTEFHHPVWLVHTSHEASFEHDCLIVLMVEEDDFLHDFSTFFYFPTYYCL